MLNSEQNVQQEVSVKETLSGDVIGDLEKSEPENTGQTDAVDNEQEVVNNDADEIVGYETKQQWRKREKSLVAQRELAEQKAIEVQRENIQLAQFVNNFMRPNGEAVPSGVSESNPSAPKSFKEQMADYQKEEAIAKIKQQHEQKRSNFFERFNAVRDSSEKVESASKELGYYVTQDMLDTLSHLSKNYKTDEFLAHMLVNEPDELKRLYSLSPADRTEELTEKAYNFRASRSATKSNAPAPAKKGIMNHASPQVDINKRSVEEHKAAIREREKRLNKWQTRS